MDALPEQMTVGEYLRFEQTSEVKHEFHDGRLVAMIGATRAHVRLTLRLLALLGRSLQDGPCEVMSGDFKVRVEEANRFFYPDLFVDCAGSKGPDELFTSEVPMIVEVLSASTEGYDRGEKFQYYRMLPSLREYVLVSTSKPAIDVFRRDGEIWQIGRTLVDGDVLSLSSVGVSLDVADIYQGIDLA
jgi:Uma2 family endonuclease